MRRGNVKPDVRGFNGTAGRRLRGACRRDAPRGHDQLLTRYLSFQHKPANALPFIPTQACQRATFHLQHKLADALPFNTSRRRATLHFNTSLLARYLSTQAC